MKPRPTSFANAHGAPTFLPLVGLALGLFASGPAAADSVVAREESVVLPTYVAGDPDPNPMFYFGRASQGAEGRVYPYPLYDTLTHRKEDRTYRIVYLENEYVRVGVLPEIGGRLFEGIDKSNGYPFIYRQHVIKPALIGLIGAWISGGIEWNIPHHHRATTFLPVQHRVEKEPGGGLTVWVGELELRDRLRWAVGYTLRPGSSVLEAKVRILNRTPLVHTMLCFANVAVHATDDYQVIFPPRTQWVTHHHKREFTTWPVATTRYGGWDFAPGTDVSWFRNHLAANSMFAWNDEDDFLAGYDHGRQAGLLAIADHHVVPGKKLWTWGNGPRGRMWDKILTDDDGPYLELMVGAYSDNQPDYSWLQPGETKVFSMSWYPFRELGGVKQANLDAAVNLECTNGVARLGFCTTSARRRAIVRLTAGDRVLLEETTSLAPDRPWLGRIPLPGGLEPHQVRAALLADGRELVAYTPLTPAPEPRPQPVTPPGDPASLATLEELYLTGLRIEQFHHPTLEPEPYWDEALRRDSGDVRVNTALGIRRLEQARLGDAERHLRRALERSTDRYTSPKDGEASYYLGVTLQQQGRYDAATKALRKAAWSAAWSAPALYQAAEIACRQGHPAEALDLVRQSLDFNRRNTRALHLQAALLRHLGRRSEARQVLDEARPLDPLEVRNLAERWLLTASRSIGLELLRNLESHPANALEVAAEFWNVGLWSDGEQVLNHLVARTRQPDSISPLVHYYLGEFAERQGHPERAAACREAATRARPDYVFPFQWEVLPVLRAALEANPRDARAPYYLGNLLYDAQPAEATRWWEQAATLDPDFPIVQRNLAIAYLHQPGTNRLAEAIAHLERAVNRPDPQPRHLTELDELYEAAGTPPEPRLALLERHAEVAARRDDALSRLIALEVALGKPDAAIARLTGRSFAVWEGSALAVADCWTDAHLLRGHVHRASGRLREALADYQAAANIPDNLPTENRGSGHRQPELDWWQAAAWEAMGDTAKATDLWRAAARETPGDAVDPQDYYRARALEKLGQTDSAKRLYEQLIATARSRLQGSDPLDFYASFGERQSQRSRLAEAHLLAALGAWGLGDREGARREREQALAINPGHFRARILSFDGEPRIAPP